MIISIVLSILFVLSASAYLLLYLRPKRTCERLVSSIRKLGYKVYAYDFVFMGHARLNQVSRDKLKHKDGSHSQRYTMPGYDIAIMNTFHQPTIVVLSPTLIKQSLSAEKFNLFPKKTGGTLALFISLIKDGLLFSEGQNWKQSKKLLSKVFTFDFIASQTEIISKVCDQVLNNKEKQASSNGLNSGNTYQIEIEDIGTCAFSQVVVSSFLGLEASQDTIERKPIQAATLQMFASTKKLIKSEKSIILLGPKFVELGLKKSHRDFKAMRDKVRGFIRRKIQKLKYDHQVDFLNQKQYQANVRPPTIIELMIEQMMIERSSIYSEEKMIDEIGTFMFAGTETTTRLFTFAAMTLYDHPQVLNKARQQISEHIKSDADIKVEELKKLVYLEAVQYEILRMFAPVGGNLPRVALQDTLIGDIPIKKGAVVVNMVRPMLNDPSVFPEPLEFRPERWMEESTKQHLPLVMMAFSSGPRSCIGKHLALLESKIMLVKVIQRYKSMEKLHERLIDSGLNWSYGNTEVKLTKLSE